MDPNVGETFEDVHADIGTTNVPVLEPEALNTTVKCDPGQDLYLGNTPAVVLDAELETLAAPEEPSVNVTNTTDASKFDGLLETEVPLDKPKRAATVIPTPEEFEQAKLVTTHSDVAVVQPADAKTLTVLAAKPSSATRQVEERGINLAAAADGAVVVAANKEAKKPSKALDGDVDSFLKNDCGAYKWLIVELSQLGRVDEIELTMKELYSSRVKDFIVKGRQSHPKKDGGEYVSHFDDSIWILLGNYTAENKKGTQVFPVHNRQWVRYVLFVFVTHYGNEDVCAINSLSALGVTAAQELEEALAQQLTHPNTNGHANERTSAPEPKPESNTTSAVPTNSSVVSEAEPTLLADMVNSSAYVPPLSPGSCNSSQVIDVSLATVDQVNSTLFPSSIGVEAVISPASSCVTNEAEPAVKQEVIRPENVTVHAESIKLEVQHKVDAVDGVGAAVPNAKPAAKTPVAESPTVKGDVMMDGGSAGKPKQAGNLFDVVKQEMMTLKLNQTKLWQYIRELVDVLNQRAAEMQDDYLHLDAQYTALQASYESLQDSMAREVRDQVALLVEAKLGPVMRQVSVQEETLRKRDLREIAYVICNTSVLGMLVSCWLSGEKSRGLRRMVMLLSVLSGVIGSLVFWNLAQRLLTVQQLA